MEEASGSLITYLTQVSEKVVESHGNPSQLASEPGLLALSWECGGEFHAVPEYSFCSDALPSPYSLQGLGQLLIQEPRVLYPYC